MKKEHILLLCLISLHTYATVIWNGIMSSGSAHATDENIEITGDTWLPDEIIFVEALNTDVTIHMLNGPHHVYNSDLGPTTLILTADAPYTITIEIPEHLYFGGMKNDISIPLMIQTRGNGRIEWRIEKNKKLYFGTGEEDRGGAVLAVTRTESTSIRLEHIFTSQGETKEAQIIFNKHSAFKHLIEEALFSITNLATFDLSNIESGKFKVEFKDGSNFFLTNLLPSLP